jgi:hypothetical protein
VEDEDEETVRAHELILEECVALQRCAPLHSSGVFLGVWACVCVCVWACGRVGVCVSLHDTRQCCTRVGVSSFVRWGLKGVEVPVGTAPGAAELQALKFASSDDVAAFMATRLWFDVPAAVVAEPMGSVAPVSCRVEHAVSPVGVSTPLAGTPL